MNKTSIMAKNNPMIKDKLEGTIQGIILRTSANFYGRYAYSPLPRFYPFVVTSDKLNAILSDRLIAAPHFPDITILDSIPGNILYQTHNTSPDYFHVYNLISGRHFHLPFPYPFIFVNAAIFINEEAFFKLFVVCIEDHQNPIFVEENNPKPVLFYLYSSKRKKWSCVDNPFSFLTSDKLLTYRRKPIHVDESSIFIDLTAGFLIRFSAMNGHVQLLPKTIHVDEAARYGECNGCLHCARIDVENRRVEVWRMQALVGVWGLVAVGKEGVLKGRVVGLHPKDESLVFMRSEVDDEILLVDIRRDLRWVVVGGRGPRCGQTCWLKGMSEVLEAALEGGERLRRSDCGVLHPHENAEGPEGEIFIVSVGGKHMDLRTLIMHYLT